MSSLLQVRGLQKTFGDRTVVDNVSYRVSEGEIVGLLGPNGAGKTTTFRMTVGMINPDRGKVTLGGTDITRLPMHKRARLGMGYLSQEPSIFRHMTVTENLLAVMEARGLSKSERLDRADELLDEFGLQHVAGSRSVTLSGGERRRLELARTLSLDPSLILLDEPFSGVDPIAVEDIQVQLRRLRERGIAILITDHAVRETLGTTDRAYIIYEGQIFRHGDAVTLADDPQVRAVYLGEKFSLPDAPAPLDDDVELEAIEDDDDAEDDVEASAEEELPDEADAEDEDDEPSDDEPIAVVEDEPPPDPLSEQELAELGDAQPLPEEPDPFLDDEVGPAPRARSARAETGGDTDASDDPESAGPTRRSSPRRRTTKKKEES